MGLTLSRVHQVEAGELAAVLAKKKNADLQNQEIFIHARAHKQTEIIQVGGGVAPGLVLCCVSVFVGVCVGMASRTCSSGAPCSISSRYRCRACRVHQSEGRRDMLIKEAEGEAQQIISRARGEAKAIVNAANAEASSIREVSR